MAEQRYQAVLKVIGDRPATFLSGHRVPVEVLLGVTITRVTPSAHPQDVVRGRIDLGTGFQVQRRDAVSRR